MGFLLSPERVKELMKKIEEYPPYEEGEEMDGPFLDGTDPRFDSTMAKFLIDAHIKNGGTI